LTITTCGYSGHIDPYACAHLFGIKQTGLRFFTVYGPWGRPDMTYDSFARAIMAGQPITLCDGGRLRRDFTYIDDIVAGVSVRWTVRARTRSRRSGC
jgi:UDP-glucuronate 4-epimerase